MRHNLVPLSQNDSRWSKEKLGGSPITLGQAGCYVTSFSVVAQYYGHIINPSEMNQTLIEKNLFVKGNLISNADDLTDIFTDVRWTISYYYPNKPPTPANLSLLRDLMSDPRKSVILCIDLHNGSIHFTPVVDCDGSSVTILDVWDGKEKDFKTFYGDPATNILRFIVYEGTPQNIPITPPSDSETTLRLERDHNYNLLVSVLDELDSHPTEKLSKEQATTNAISILKDLKQRVDSLTQLNEAMRQTSTPSTAPDILPTIGEVTKKKGKKGKNESSSITTVVKTNVFDSLYTVLQRWGVLEK